MIFWPALILGLIQALTEFLPVSSSGHLILARLLMDFDVADGLTFDVALHVGTLAAIAVYFRKDFLSLIRSALPGQDSGRRRLALGILIGCIPAGIAGVFGEKLIEIYFRNPAVIVVTLVAGAILFFVAERKWNAQGEMEQLSIRGAVVIGIAQTLALIPGVSRSGITIVAGMQQGLRRDEAARFSFLLGAPLLAGAGAKKALDLAGQPLLPGEGAALLTGLVTSAVVGWLVIRFLISFLRRHPLHVFAWYRIALAVAMSAILYLAR